MMNASTLRCCCLRMSMGTVVAVAIVTAGCASAPDRYKLPPPRNTQALPSAHGVLYGNAPAKLSNPTNLCITSAGHCPLPTTTETGLPCTCDSKNPEFTYGGSTGPIPPMPDWADPRLKHTN